METSRKPPSNSNNKLLRDSSPHDPVVELALRAATSTPSKRFPHTSPNGPSRPDALTRVTSKLGTTRTARASSLAAILSTRVEKSEQPDSRRPWTSGTTFYKKAPCITCLPARFSWPKSSSPTSTTTMSSLLKETPILRRSVGDRIASLVDTNSIHRPRTIKAFPKSAITSLLWLSCKTSKRTLPLTPSEFSRRSAK